MRKIAVLVLLLIVGYVFFSAAVWHLNDGFCLRHIQADNLVNWKSSPPDEKAVKDLLKQNFYYIGKGSQCYVFESEDHDVVLKFFRHSRYRSHPINALITAPEIVTDIIKQKEQKKKDKLKTLFISCELAYQELREETGLVYLHLNTTDYLKQTVVLYDKLKRPMAIAIDDYAFLIQKKGEQTLTHLTRLLEQGKKKEAKVALASLSATLKKCLRKGIIDTDGMIHKNAGFRNHKAIILDVGGFERRTPNNPQITLWQTTRRLRTWLQNHDPELASYFEHTINEPLMPIW
jgi:hypothetical protein